MYFERIGVNGHMGCAYSNVHNSRLDRLYRLNVAVENGDNPTIERLLKVIPACDIPIDLMRSIGYIITHSAKETNSK